jgi:hypothetical protein
MKQSLNEVKRMQQLAGLIKEEQLKVKRQGFNFEPVYVDTKLIDKLLFQLAPAIDHDNIKNLTQNPDYKGILQKIAKHITNTGALSSDLLDFED